MMRQILVWGYTLPASICFFVFLLCIGEMIFKRSKAGITIGRLLLVVVWAVIPVVNWVMAAILPYSVVKSWFPNLGPKITAWLEKEI